MLSEFIDDATFDRIALSRHDDRLGVALISMRCGHSNGGRRSRSCGRGGFSRIGIAVLSRTELFKILARVADHADVVQAGHIVALLKEIGQQRTCDLGFLFKSGLVGFVGEEHVANFDLVAGMFLKLIDDTALDSVALSRHNDWNCHMDASSRKKFSQFRI